MDLTRKPGHNGSIARGFSRKIRAALTLFAEAHNYAKDTKLTVWEYAIEADVLLAAGLTPNDIRWFLHKGWVEHRQETTKSDTARRSFCRCRGGTLGYRSCFVLTDAGLALNSRITHGAYALAVGADPRILRQRPDRGSSVHPHWDVKLRELSLDGQLIKCLKTSAPCQQIILAAFEEEGWPPHIDDPLPKGPGKRQDSKRRLKDTIKRLNRSHLIDSIRFSGDGTGEGVRWDWIAGRRSC